MRATVIRCVISHNNYNGLATDEASRVRTTRQWQVALQLRVGVGCGAIISVSRSKL